MAEGANAYNCMASILEHAANRKGGLDRDAPLRTLKVVRRSSTAPVATAAHPPASTLERAASHRGVLEQSASFASLKGFLTQVGAGTASGAFDPSDQVELRTNTERHEKIESAYHGYLKTLDQRSKDAKSRRQEWAKWDEMVRCQCANQSIAETSSEPGRLPCPCKTRKRILLQKQAEDFFASAASCSRCVGVCAFGYTAPPRGAPDTASAMAMALLSAAATATAVAASETAEASDHAGGGLAEAPLPSVAASAVDPVPVDPAPVGGPATAPMAAGSTAPSASSH